MLNIQGGGDNDEWEGLNMPLYNVPGLVKSNRSTTQEASYTLFFR